MRIDNCIIYIIFLFISTACNIDKKKFLVCTDVKYDTIMIKNDYPYLGRYSKNGITVKSGTRIMAGYNRFTHSLDFFDLSCNKSLLSLSLEEGGENAISSQIVRIHIAPDYCIIKQSNFQLLKIDFEGKVLNKVDGYEITDPASGNMYKISPGGFKIGNFLPAIAAYPGKPTVIQTLYPVAKLREDNLNDHYIGAEINMDSGELRFIPVRYGDILKPEQLEGYSNMIYPYITDQGDFLLINLPFCSDVWLYDRKKGKLSHYNPQSIITTNRLIPDPLMKPPANFRYEYESVRFLETYYSHKLDVFYRIHLGEYDRDEKKRDCRVLMIMDKNMEVLSETKLPSYFMDDHFVCDDVIYFYLKNDTDDMYLGAVNVSDQL